MNTTYTEYTLRRGHRDPVGEKIAAGMGWFSIVLGLSELIGARSLARWLGIPENESLLRTYGLREIAAGIGVLTAKDPTPWMWTRLAGDAMDIGSLAAGLNDGNPHEDHVAIALANVLVATAVDAYGIHRLSGQTRAD